MGRRVEVQEKRSKSRPERRWLHSVREEGGEIVRGGHAQPGGDERRRTPTKVEQRITS